MNLYYYKVVFQRTSAPKYYREFRILAEQESSANYIFEKIIKDFYSGINYSIVVKNKGSIHDMSPILIEMAANREGYYNSTEYEISIELLLPFTAVNCRHEIIDEVLANIKNIGA